MTTVPGDPSQPLDGLPIKDASRALGVPAPTLRSWELRYGVAAAPRSRGGHRRYSDQDLTELRLMRDEIARGRRAADAARFVRQLLDEAGQGARYVADLLAASQRRDPADVRAALDRARDDLGLAVTVDDVLMPAMRQIGTWWETGRCDVAQEHLTTEVARAWLNRLLASAPVPHLDLPLVLACGPRDQHTLGLECLELLLTYYGHTCRNLGARTTELTLLNAATATSAVAVVVVSHLATHLRPTSAVLRACAERGYRVFYAGNAFVFPSARKNLPGTYLDENVAAAARLITAALNGRA